MPSRRQFLRNTLAILAATSGINYQAKALNSSSVPSSGALSCFIPGYKPGYALYRGTSILDDASSRKYIPENYEGPLTMLSRVGVKGEPVHRVIYPIQGHGISIHPDTRTGFFAANKHADNNMVAFDTVSLEPVAMIPVHRKGWFGGGHALYTPDGAYLLITERSPDRTYSGKLENHFGAITVRDASSYKVLSELNCFGISPHEIAVTNDGQHLIVANYGSTAARGMGKAESLPEILEPCLTVIELATGRLLEKIIGPNSDSEIRHLAAPDLSRIFAIQARLGDDEKHARIMQPFSELNERDITARKDRAYLPAHLLHIARQSGGKAKLHELKGVDPLLVRHGLSIIYEPKHDEILATFPSSHSLMVFDSRNGELKHVIRTNLLGLRFPSGLALHPNGTHYIVTGYWRNMYQFERGSHTLDQDACQYVSLFGHSHIAIT